MTQIGKWPWCCTTTNWDNSIELRAEKIHPAVSKICVPKSLGPAHYNDFIMSALASQIISLTIVYSTVYSRRRSKKTSKPRVTGLSAGNSPETGEFPTQRASNAENVSIWWRHHASTGPPGSGTTNNRPVSQISECACSISHNALFRNRNVHISVLSGPLWGMKQVHSGICELGQFHRGVKWLLVNWSCWSRIVSRNTFNRSIPTYK